MMSALMRISGRTAVISLLVVMATLLMSVQAFGVMACVDGCDEGGRAACADCPLCSPTRTAVLLSPLDNPAVEPAGDHESLPTVHLLRTEDRGVFHVPKRLV